MLLVRLPDRVHDELERLASSMGVRPSELAAKVLQEYLEQQAGDKPVNRRSEYRFHMRRFVVVRMEMDGRRFAMTGMVEDISSGGIRLSVDPVGAIEMESDADALHALQDGHRGGALSQRPDVDKVLQQAKELEVVFSLPDKGVPVSFMCKVCSVRYEPKLMVNASFLFSSWGSENVLESYLQSLVG